MRRVTGRLCVAALLTLCAAVYALEMSARWDRSIQDANDEAGFIAIVLCVGVALSAAGSLRAYIHASPTTVRVRLATAPTRRRAGLLVVLPVSVNSPPLRLRI